MEEIYILGIQEVETIRVYEQNVRTIRVLRVQLLPQTSSLIRFLKILALLFFTLMNMNGNKKFLFSIKNHIQLGWDIHFSLLLFELTKFRHMDK